ncbi:glycyl-radical enzyme activating protein [Bacteroides sp. 519]|uniref:glycyl-radical enzyme activating protein n=1 Tax=Bacteroides sp. 519 TaxID=2302937 RepID=UPI0013D4436C|nr:glycyl-radical enzyme activating protein [Bacteroides sp. 519]NDV58722.1 glycyl-radical enzyme activating protein [Bacteroides sp. 519]
MKINLTEEGQSDTSCLLRIYDIAEFSVHDGPGVRVVIYFQGCNARCEWCHSPHSQLNYAPLLFNPNVCIGCQRCVSACKNQCHVFIENKHIINRDKCIQCGSCVEQCPASVTGVKGSALHLPTVEVSVSSLFEQVSPYLQLGGKKGGITLSGGEALLQTDAAKQLLQLCKQNGYHTAVETSGLLSPEIYKNVLPLVDLWLFGMRVVTGKDHKRHYKHIQKVLKLLTDENANILPRIPMVPGFFDRDDVLEDILELFKEFSLSSVCLNPWNPYYDAHYMQSGIPLQINPPSQEEIKACEDKISLVFTNFNTIKYENNETKH